MRLHTYSVSSAPSRVVHLTAESFASLLAVKQADPRRTGAGWQARCVHPGHDDDTPSLTFRDGDHGLIVHCHGCAPRKDRERWFQELLAAAKDDTPLPPASPSARTTGGNGTGTRECEYVYSDAQDTPLARKVRYRNPKSFSWERPYGDRWVPGLGHGGHA